MDEKVKAVVGKKAKTKGAPRSKRSGANDGMARQRYWASMRLMERKIRNLMRHCKMTRADARKLWLASRKRYRGKLPSA